MATASNRKRTTNPTPAARAKAAEARAKALNDNPDLRAALEAEKAGYEARGDAARVQQVKDYIAKLDGKVAPAEPAPRVPVAAVGPIDSQGTIPVVAEDVRDQGIPAADDTAPGK